MKTSFWRRWLNSLRFARPTGQVSRARPRRLLLCLEALEDRVTPSLTPQMVLDINPNTLSSNPSAMVAIGSTSYFSADDGVHGVELWKSDGTEAGTALVKDIIAGSANAYPSNLTNVNGTLFFTTGYELWKSNGTAAGTVLLKEFPAVTPGESFGGPGSLTNVNGTLFFTGYDVTHGTELWKSDGTVAGTTLVKDIVPGIYTSPPIGLTNVNGTLFFVAFDGYSSMKLWTSDGTATGTTFVKNFSGGLSNLTNVNGKLFFTANDDTIGNELWKSDGTADGTTLVKDINPGTGGSQLQQLTNVNAELFFTAVDGTGTNGLWKSNGTAAGTVLVSASAFNPSNLTNVNGTLFFTAYDDTQGTELWTSDGTVAGTVLVKDIYPGGYYPNSSYPGNLTNVNGTLFFTADDGTNGRELWQSDGTAAGTALVKDINPGNISSNLYSLTNVNGTLFFSVDNAVTGRELWNSDGTAAGTALVKDINTSSVSSFPSNPTDVNGTLFFAADDGVHGSELWKSDGTAAGTTLVKDINPGTNGSYLNSLTNVNGTLFFTTGWELWKSDGTEAGTVRVKSVGAGNLTNMNGILYFTADDGELWTSDGTTAGTTLVKDIYPGSHREYGYYGGYWYVPNASNPGSLTNVNGTLFFTADDGTNGRELWQSDGTAAGTVLVKDIRPGTNGSYPNSSNPNSLTNVNGTLFFGANDGSNGSELWKSDGTADGTVLVKDINPGSANASPSNQTNVNGTLFFSAYNATTGWELWMSNGTAAGTVQVKDIRPGSASASPSNLTNVNGTLVFTAADGTFGPELWQSDGTAAGTVLVKDVNPGWNGSFARYLTNVNGILFFDAVDDTNSRELWQSDGTAAGTVLVANLAPSWLTNVNGTLLFAANDGTHGTELWKVPPPPAGPVVNIGDVAVTEGNTGTRTAIFAVTLSAASSQPVSVSYATANGTAVAGSDYQAASGTLTIPAGQTTGTITVLVNGDRLGEGNENFVLNLSAPTNANIADGQGIGTILDDEPRISIGDKTVTEGNTGSTSATFTVTLSAAYDATVTVAYSTANGTATAGSDYAATSGTLTFAPGQISKTVTVQVIGDRLPEANDTFFVNLSGATNATIADGQGQGTIVDDEPRISIGDVTKAEGKKGQTTLFTFTVTLSAVYDQAVTMSFRTVDGSAKTSDSDYVAKTGTLTFAPGETTKTITIEVKGDSKKEADETFYLDLFALSSNALFTKYRGLGTILNDD